MSDNFAVYENKKTYVYVCFIGLLLEYYLLSKLIYDQIDFFIYILGLQYICNATLQQTIYEQSFGYNICKICNEFLTGMQSHSLKKSFKKEYK